MRVVTNREGVVPTRLELGCELITLTVFFHLGLNVWTVCLTDLGHYTTHILSQ